MSKLALELTIKCFETKDPCLDLGRCGLTDEDFVEGSELDVALRKCVHLEELVLSNKWFEWRESTKHIEKFSRNQSNENKFATAPPALCELSNLTSLICAGSYDGKWGIRDMSFINRLINLRQFNISYAKITQIKGLDNLTQLQKLSIAGNKITEIKGLKNLTQLQKLNIHNNEINEIKGLGNLKHLQQFDISSNEITEIKELENLTQLLQLDISGNKITELKGLDTLTQLQEFYISFTKITEIKGLEKLIQLQQLDISSVEITELKGLDTLTQLQQLHISFTKITEIKGLEKLTQIQQLDIVGNQITELKGLENLTQLQRLNLRNNLITELKGLETLTSLQQLIVAYNKITEIKGLDRLTRLQQFDISNNQITSVEPLVEPFLLRKELPLQLILQESYDTKEGEINVGNNPLTAPPVEIAAQGNEAVLNWFRARAQGSIINREAKCILMGNGEAGKTALSHQLRKHSFLETNIRTHGILIEEWIVKKEDFPLNLQQKINVAIQVNEVASEMGQSIEMPESLVLKLWDFGGQEYYHATHRLFMSSNALYLLLWETVTNKQQEEKGKDAPDYPVSYWKKNILHFSPQNITLRIQNKVIKNAERTDDLNYKIAYRDKADAESIAQYERDIKIVKQGILNQLANLSYIGEIVPKVYDNIRMALRKEKRPWISYEDYKQTCLDNDTTASKLMLIESQRETLIRFLDDTGAVVCFRFRKNMEVEQLKNYVFTNPVWLTNIIYEILAREVVEFDMAYAESIVSKYGLDTGLVIEIMKQFELTFGIEKEGKMVCVVPQYLPGEYPNKDALKWALKGKAMPHSFTFKYPGFLPKSNFLRLINKYGTQTIDYLYWKKGFIFFINDKTVFAKCINEEAERKITIDIQDNDAKTAKEIFESLIKIDDADDLQVSVNETDYVPVKKLREKIFNNNSEIESTEGKTLPVSDFNMLFGKKKATEKLQAANMPKDINIFVSYSSKDRDLRELLMDGLKGHLVHRPGFNFHLWSDKEIDLGAGWKEQIETALTNSDASILLVSASFMASNFINENELAEFFKRKKEDGYLILPVLARSYNFSGFEALSSLQFFKTYYPDYGFNKPIDRNKLMHFDKLAENENTTEQQLNEYYTRLADKIYEAAKNKYS